MRIGHYFFDQLEEAVTALGGYHNAHLHLDRANTLEPGFVDGGKLEVLGNSHISLQRKHALIQTVHNGRAYDQGNLLARVARTVDVMAEAGTRVGDTMIDVTPDRVGTDALEWVMDLAAKEDRMQVRCAAYTPLGFSDAEPQRWEVFERGVAKADFIGSLPEADDIRDYPGNIGFEEHCIRVLELGRKTGKMIHVHTDQFNLPGEDGTERLIEVMRKTGRHDAPDGAPLVWAVHMISPSTYEEPRWQGFVEGLLECNIGVISCPSAAIGMRQIRPVPTPTYNAIPRLLELGAAGVPIRLGSDNVADMCSPSTTADLTDEVFMLSAALRYYSIPVLAKWAAGVMLAPEDKEELRDHLEKNDLEVAKAIRRWQG